MTDEQHSSAAPARTPRRILFYTHALVGGGAERVWALMASALKARGHDVHFAVDFVAQENHAFLADDVPLHVLGSGHGASVLALARLLRGLRPDVAFAAIGASDLKLLLAKGLARVPAALVLSVHGRYDAEKHLLGRLTYLATPLTARLAARTLAVSQHLADYLSRRFFLPARLLGVIHNGVVLPPASSVPDAAALAARPPVVLAIGRLVPEKGYDVLLDALALLPVDVRLVVLGEGPEREALMAQAQRLGVASRVEFAGFMPDPAPALHAARCLALASRSEAFGNVVVEALGHGLPVVASMAGGPAEILHGRPECGTLVPVDDAPALAAALAQALAYPGDPAPRRAYAESFAVERVARRYEALVEDILSARGGV